MAEPEAPLSREAADALRRAEALAGRTLGELAQALEVPLPASFGRSKGFVGRLVERALGLSLRPVAGPDLPDLEVKTLPIDARGRSAESTFVCCVPREGLELRWAASAPARKLARVLFVPVEAEGEGPGRRLGSAFLWRPSAEEDAVLARDWDDVTAWFALAGHERISARLGVALQVRPKAARASERRTFRDDSGALSAALPRAFYLRRTFTTAILARAGFADATRG